MEPMTFVKAMMQFFGKKDAQQTLAGFKAELDALTQDDREWFKQELTKAGYTIIA